MKSFDRTDASISMYKKLVHQIVRQDKSMILREIVRVWNFYLPVIGQASTKFICQCGEVCFFFSLSLSSLKVRAYLVENKADRDVKPGDFRTRFLPCSSSAIKSGFRDEFSLPASAVQRSSAIFTPLQIPSSVLRRFHP